MSNKYIGITTIASILVLAGCSSGGSSSGSDPLIIGESETGTAATDVSTDDLRRSAARLASDSLGLNVNEVLGIALVGSEDDTGQVPMVGDQIEDADLIDDEVDSLLRASLALDSADATITREGNIITIDPDEAALCAEDALGDVLVAQEVAQCESVYKNLLVVLDAQTDDTGVLTYQYLNDPILSIGYSPNGGSYELDLAGLKALVRDSSDGASLPDTMSGAIRVVAEVDSASGITAAGKFSLLVTKPISIIDSDQDVNISLDNSELFSVSSDNNGMTTVKSSFGALNVSLPVSASDDDGLGNVSTPNMLSLVVSSFTNQIDIDESKEEIRLTNGGTTINYGIDSGESIRLTVNNYGMTLNSENISINPGLTLGASLSGVMEQFGDDAIASGGQLNISAPSGTVLIPNEASDSTRIQSGSLSYDVSVDTNQGTVAKSFSASAGECITSAGGADSSGGVGEDDTDLAAALAKVACGTP